MRAVILLLVVANLATLGWALVQYQEGRLPVAATARVAPPPLPAGMTRLRLAWEAGAGKAATAAKTAEAGKQPPQHPKATPATTPVQRKRTTAPHARKIPAKSRHTGRQRKQVRQAAGKARHKARSVQAAGAVAAKPAAQPRAKQQPAADDGLPPVVELSFRHPALAKKHSVSPASAPAPVRERPVAARPAPAPAPEPTPAPAADTAPADGAEGAPAAGGPSYLMVLSGPGIDTEPEPLAPATSQAPAAAKRAVAPRPKAPSARPRPRPAKTPPGGLLTASRCYTVGTLKNAAAAKVVRARFQAQGYRARIHAAGERQVRDYLVYLPARPKAEAKATIAQLVAKGIKDYYLRRNGSISLGLYRREPMARRRRDQLAALGFEAQVRPRYRAGGYRVDVDFGRVRRLRGYEWDRLLSGYTPLQEMPTACW